MAFLGNIAIRHSAIVRSIAAAVLLVTASCGSSASTVAPKAIATSSTTAEEARAIDGPLMRYPETSSASGKLANLLQGVLQFDKDCLYLVDDRVGQRFPILWPAGTKWDGPNQSAVSPAGVVMKIGISLTGRGGYYFLSDIDLLAGTAASNLAATCVDGTGQIAAFQNVDTAIGPTKS